VPIGEPVAEPGEPGDPAGVGADEGGSRMRRYDPALGEALCVLVADGRGLKSASATLGIPRRSAREWEVGVPEFASALGAARRNI
jgi:hypothetical protein